MLVSEGGLHPTGDTSNVSGQTEAATGHRAKKVALDF